MEVFLYNSTVCRLCGEENDNGTLLYSCEENSQNLSDLINTFLPIKVTDDGQLPRTICPGCTIQLEATVEFMTLIINGQKIIRELFQREKEYKSNIFNNSSKEEDVITENVVYEITSNGLYQLEHPMALAAAGLEKPKRKRGRPPKKSKNTEAQVAAKQETLKPKHIEEPSGKRRRKTPTRFREAVQGKELERIFIEEGVTDGNSDTESNPEVKQEVKPTPKEPEVIGHLEDSGELVVVVKGKGRGRPKAKCRVRQTRQECAICGMEFSCVGRYMSHVASHGPVAYQCAQCGQACPTRLLFTAHQRDTRHEGQVVIPCAKTGKDAVKKRKSPVEQPSPDSLDLAPVDTMVSNACRGLPDLNPVPLDEPTPTLPDIEPTASEAHAQERSNKAVEVVKQTDSTDKSEEVKTDEPNKTETEDDKAKKSKQKLKCNQCDKVFSSKQSKSIHIKAAHAGERPYACGECGAAFAYPRSLSLHTLSHRRQRAPPKGYACDLCGKVLNHPSSVVYHKEAEHAGQRYVCNKCGKSFKHKQLLQRHQLVHSQHRPFHCKTCDASFKTKANLLNHQVLHTGVKKFTCEICKHKFAHKTSLTLHMRWHTGHKPYSCGKCGKSFSQKGNLSEHERIHTGEKPFECNLCHRRFTTSSQHRLHARRHNSDRPYACTSCDKRFTSRGSWAAHVRREAGARAHVCGACGRGFAERWGLHKHMRRHTGERPFRCPHCPRAFADCSNLNKHKRQVHKQISLLAQTGSAGGGEDKAQEKPSVQAEAETEAETGAETEAETEAESEERVIYVAYDIDDKEPAYHIIDPEQGSDIEMEMELEGGKLPQPLLVPLDLESQKHMPVTDEQGNPLHFTMQDGTRLAITSADGQSLQVITQDGQTIPVEINGFADEEEVENPDTIVHQLNLQKSVEGGAQPVTHFYTLV